MVIILFTVLLRFVVIEGLSLLELKRQSFWSDGRVVHVWFVGLVLVYLFAEIKRQAIVVGVVVISWKIVASIHTLGAILPFRFLPWPFICSLIVLNNLWLEQLLQHILFLLIFLLLQLFHLHQMIFTIIIEPFKSLHLSVFSHFLRQGWIQLGFNLLLFQLFLLLSKLCHFFLSFLLFLHQFFVLMRKILRRTPPLLPLIACRSLHFLTFYWLFCSECFWGRLLLRTR